MAQAVEILQVSTMEPAWRRDRNASERDDACNTEKIMQNIWLQDNFPWKLIFYLKDREDVNGLSVNFFYTMWWEGWNGNSWELVKM